ncbi:uncharacterized protein LOC124153042 [Haliotis rufescens]|uniref:uncharacterized protein LOC124153042 n=1 Tax=Haliotis rufescens TaxID=6454 RepID=UPI00201F8C40|nr:uncharacterized protein LOC124153042 [Haliotis rufescens]
MSFSKRYHESFVCSTSAPCTNCDSNNVTCVDGVCPPRCVNVSSSGECLQCRDSRFYGEQCEHDCPDTCLNSRCQMNNTRAVCTEGCVAGRKGDNCGVNCPKACTQCERYGDGCTGPCQNALYYGPNCRTPCSSNCTDGCNRITGECDSCKPGYKCDVTCPPNCRDGCDKDTGECVSCVSGYRGKNCNDTCPPNCSDGCDKEIGKCDGCNPGNSGKYCNISCPTTCREGCNQDGGCNETGNNVVIAVVIIAGILGLVVLSVTIPLVCNQVQKRSTARVVAPDIEQDISEHSYDNIDNTFFDMEDKVADAVPVDDPNNTRSLRSSHPIGASAEEPQRANHKEFITAPVMKGGAERLSNETIVVFLPKPSVHVHYINTTPRPEDILHDYNYNSWVTMATLAVTITLVILISVPTLAPSSGLCTDCEDNKRICVGGVCALRCVNLTSSGQCLQCRDSRFYGRQCEHDCPDTCLNSRCQLDNSLVMCTEGCVVGKKGDNCGADCDAACTQCERYGDGCTGPCQNPRYYGPLCRTPCPPSCSDGCDKDRGKCGTCITGYLGTYCNVTCSSQSCITCDKDTEKCTQCDESHIECNDGVCQGEACHSDATTALPEKPDGLTTVHILMIVCSVLSTLLLVGALQAVKKKCKKRRRSHQDAITDSSTQAEGSGSSTYLAHKYWEINDQDVGPGMEQALLTNRRKQSVAFVKESVYEQTSKENRVKEEIDVVPDVKPKVDDTVIAKVDVAPVDAVDCNKSEWHPEHIYEPVSGSKLEGAEGQSHTVTHEDRQMSSESLQLLELIAASANADVRYLTTRSSEDSHDDISDECTPCSNCDGNNVACVDSVCLPRCVNVTSSGECLQCLDSRFYGKQCEHDCPDTCLNSRCQMDNSRVVCTEGCVAGKKGDNCGVNCPTACTQCERYGDGCTAPCQNPRYYGQHCRTPCSSSCTDGCNRITGECDICEPGYMGDKCNVSCPPTCRDGCDKDTGECGSCEPGYMGDKCNVSCPPTCRDGCDKDTGECDSCEPGYTGDKCNVTCPPNCRDGCDKDTGECGSCEPGYSGDRCDVTCSPNCTDGCDKDSGECDSCVSGYRGKNCNGACPFSCRGGCDKETGKCEGCNPGNSGEYCNISCPITCRERCHQDGGCIVTGGQISPFQITTGILAMIVILVMGILILQRLSKRVERRASSTSPPPEGRTQPGPAGDSGDLHDNNGGTQPGPTSSSGDLLDRDDWTTKYWVLDLMFDYSATGMMEDLVDGYNVICVDGVCLPRCVNVTSSGKCLQCRDSRFYGKQCEHDCPDTCLNSRCQMNNSLVVCAEGCVAGKKGDNCGVNCPTACTQCERYGDGCTGPCQKPRYYGPHCRTPCSSSCADGCNRITGECVSCEPGYTGDKCDVTCPPNCGDGCDKDTGECDSCEPGYMGDKCDVTCPPNCGDGCDKDTGECGSCEPGYTGDKCDVTCPPNCGDGCDKDTGECIKLGEHCYHH